MLGVGALVALQAAAQTAPPEERISRPVLADRNYVGSVIVNEGTWRFFEPGPERTWLLRVNAAYAF